MGAEGLGSLANYGLAGVIFLSMVVPLSTLIYRGLKEQIVAKDAEIVRMRLSEDALRGTMDTIAPALTEQARVMAIAITLLNERSRV